jgi:hypothetical protein
MGFTIEKDHLADGGVGNPDRTGEEFTGPFEVRYGAMVEQLDLPATDDANQPLSRIPFRLYDDGELYYEGWLHDDWQCDNQLAALTWAKSDSGCTTIKVKRGNEWKMEVA